MSKYLTPKEVGEILDVSRATVNRWHHERRLPASTILRSGDKLYLESYIEDICARLVPLMGRHWCVYPEFYWRFHDEGEGSGTPSDPWVDVEPVLAS